MVIKTWSPARELLVNACGCGLEAGNVDIFVKCDPFGLELVPILAIAFHNHLGHARIVITAWANDYNTERPHSALNDRTPAYYARTLTTAIARPRCAK